MASNKFPPRVKQRAMEACGRRCCLCHKFCGVAMECNHIIRPTNGGKNTFENCIPLCLDCHTEVGHYDNKHPKGIKFTPEELRTHRDRWYSKIENGFSNEAPANHSLLDQQLFKRLHTLLGGSKKMKHFNDHDYSSSYSYEYDSRIDRFKLDRELPENEFFSLQMEASASDLTKAIINYQEAGMNRIWLNPNGFAGVPSEWCYGNETAERRFHEAVKVMNQKAQDVWEAFVHFVREGRRTLGIDPESN